VPERDARHDEGEDEHSPEGASLLRILLVSTRERDEEREPEHDGQRSRDRHDPPHLVGKLEEEPAGGTLRPIARRIRDERHDADEESGQRERGPPPGGQRAVCSRADRCHVRVVLRSR
jgi:hypothetical protein